MGNPFLKEFFNFEKNSKIFWPTKGGNNGRRERRNEGTTGMILPRPYSKPGKYCASEGPQELAGVFPEFLVTYSAASTAA